MAVDVGKEGGEQWLITIRFLRPTRQHSRLSLAIILSGPFLNELIAFERWLSEEAVGDLEKRAGYVIRRRASLVPSLGLVTAR